MLQLYESTATFTIDDEQDDDEGNVDIVVSAQADIRIRLPNWFGIGGYASTSFVGITYAPGIERNGEDYARFNGYGAWASYGGYLYYKHYLDLPSILFLTGEPHSFMYVLGGIGAGYSMMKYNWKSSPRQWTGYSRCRRLCAHPER
jgi:hypothetical protein